MDLAALQKPYKDSMKNIWPLNEREKWMYEKRVWEEIYTYKYFFEIVKTKKEDGIRNDVEAKTFPRFLLLNKQAQQRSEPKALFRWRSIHSFPLSLTIINFKPMKHVRKKKNGKISKSLGQWSTSLRFRAGVDVHWKNFTKSIQNPAQVGKQQNFLKL